MSKFDDFDEEGFLARLQNGDMHFRTIVTAILNCDLTLSFETEVEIVRMIPDSKAAEKFLLSLVNRAYEEKRKNSGGESVNLGGTISTIAVKEIICLLAHEKEGARSFAKEFLSQKLYHFPTDENILSGFEYAFSSSDVKVRSVAEELLKRIKYRCEPMLIRFIDSPSAGMRRFAYNNSARVSDAVAERIAGEDAAVRNKTLTDYVGILPSGTLIEYLSQECSDVRDAAVAELDRRSNDIVGCSALSLLTCGVPLLQERAFSYYREEIGDKLGCIGGVLSRVIDNLQKALETLAKVDSKSDFYKKLQSLLVEASCRYAGTWPIVKSILTEGK